MDITVAFGRAVRIRRTELGLKQDEVADESGMARSFLSGIERGSANPSVSTVWKLARGLDCTPSDLWKEAERIYTAHPETPGTI